MTKNQKIFAGIDALVLAEDIPKEMVIKSLEETLKIACKKHYNINNITVVFDTDSKRIKITGQKEVVDKDVLGEAFDEAQHIDINDALKEKKNVKIGDTIKYKLKLEPDMMERSTIASAKQVFRQNLRDAKYEKIKMKYLDKVNTVVLGQLEEEKGKFVYFKLPHNVEAVLPEKFQNPKDSFSSDKPIPLYIQKLEDRSKKGPKIIVSRTSPELVKHQLAQVVPEIKNGLIKIKNIVRDCGVRSKVAIENKGGEDFDAMGAVIGPNGNRITKVKTALGGENIDLIEYFEDPALYISNALSPALVTAVQILGKNECRVIVANDQLSLAIGANGQNVRLASQLTGWKIDIIDEEEATKQGIDFENDII